jgi:hypothetical protein
MGQTGVQLIDTTALRRMMFLILFHYRIKMRHSSVWKFWTLLVFILLIVAVLWRHFGTNASLPILADATPILLSIVGVVMSYIQPKKETHRFTTFVLIVAGLVGSAILSANRIKSENAHRIEVIGLGNKMDTVRDQNVKLSNFLLTSKGQLTEADRRRGIETVLRNEYILSHDPIDPDIISGSKMPPTSWLNSRLSEMGEKWKVIEGVPEQRQVSIERVSDVPKIAHVGFSFYQDNMAANGLTTRNEAVIQDNQLSFSIGAIVLGDVPAEHLQIWIRECNGCAWQSSLPANFAPVDEDKPSDRTIALPEMLPNVSTPKWNFTIRLPIFPKTTVVPVACYYACTNCPPVDWKKPQLLWLSESKVFKTRSLAISSMPGKIKK